MPGKRTLSSRKWNLDSIVNYLSALPPKSIVVVTGAGVSTPAGIPDFRTPGSGLYSNMKQYNIPEPEAIFDLHFFRHNPKPFCMLAKELWPRESCYKPTIGHLFVRLLQEKGLLMRLYTQNIDGLERSAGISPNLLVEAHGNFFSCHCIKCKQKADTSAVRDKIFSGGIPRCTICQGLVKPDIVFFNETLPSRFNLYCRDMPKAQLVIVMGTSLQVSPFCQILSHTKRLTPRLLINRTVVGDFLPSVARPRDVVSTGDLVASINSIVFRLGWQNSLQKLMFPVNNSESASSLESQSSPCINFNNSASALESISDTCRRTTEFSNDKSKKSYDGKPTIPPSEHSNQQKDLLRREKLSRKRNGFLTKPASGLPPSENTMNKPPVLPKNLVPPTQQFSKFSTSSNPLNINTSNGICISKSSHNFNCNSSDLVKDFDKLSCRENKFRGRDKTSRLKSHSLPHLTVPADKTGNFVRCSNSGSSIQSGTKTLNYAKLYKRMNDIMKPQDSFFEKK